MKKKIRVVVSMYGGTIESVYTDADAEMDVVFTEDHKYLDLDHENEIEINNNGRYIYTYMDANRTTPKELDIVYKAADAYTIACKIDGIPDEELPTHLGIHPSLDKIIEQKLNPSLDQTT